MSESTRKEGLTAHVFIKQKRSEGGKVSEVKTDSDGSFKEEGENWGAHIYKRRKRKRNARKDW